MNRYLLALACAALLAGCGSSVKLDDVAVEDKSGIPVGVQGAAGTSGAAGSPGAIANAGVAPVDLTKSRTDAAAPQGPNIVYFDYDSFVIKPEFQAVIEAHAKFLKADPKRRAAVEGHTDENGGREYNLALGQKRAEAVRRALGLLGVPDAQVEAVSYGKEKPAVEGHDEASWAQNRRAQIVYR
ncbi:MAG: peptidoglycan-associated lipoprotein Pal [Burkholderiaceae bacterium]